MNYPPRLDVADTLGNRSSYQAEARNAVIAPRVQNLSNAAAMLPLSTGERAGVGAFTLFFHLRNAAIMPVMPDDNPARLLRKKPTWAEKLV